VNEPDRFEPSAPKTRVAQALRLNFGCSILPVFEKFVTKAFITKNRKLSGMPLTIGWQDFYLLSELGSIYKLKVNPDITVRAADNLVSIVDAKPQGSPRPGQRGSLEVRPTKNHWSGPQKKMRTTITGTGG
jgi:hypothetical protein